MNLLNLTAAQLNHAANILEHIEKLQAELAAISSEAGGAVAAPVKTGKRKRTMSASARAKIAAAQRARWAKQKGQAVKAEAKPAGKKRKMSAAGRARIVAAQKARWAKIKAAKKA